MKAQTIRLLDVFVIGPAMVLGGAALGRRDGEALGALLVVAGALTVVYNGKNFLIQRAVEEAAADVMPSVKAFLESVFGEEGPQTRADPSTRPGDVAAAAEALAAESRRAELRAYVMAQAWLDCIVSGGTEQQCAPYRPRARG